MFSRAPGAVHAAAELTLLPEHRRGHGAMYDGLNQGAGSTTTDCVRCWPACRCPASRMGVRCRRWASRRGCGRTGRARRTGCLPRPWRGGKGKARPAGVARPLGRSAAERFGLGPPSLSLGGEGEGFMKGRVREADSKQNRFLELGPCGLGGRGAAIPEMEEHHGLVGVLAQVAERLAVQRTGPSEQDGRGSEPGDDICPGAVRSRPRAHSGSQSVMLAGRQKVIGPEPAAAVRELGVDRGDAMLAVASRHQLLEQACHTGAGPGPSTRPGALLFSPCLGLAFHEQQVIDQHPQGRITLREHTGTAQGRVQLVDEIGVYLIDTRK